VASQLKKLKLIEWSRKKLGDMKSPAKAIHNMQKPWAPTTGTAQPLHKKRALTRNCQAIAPHVYQPKSHQGQHAQDWR